MLAKIDDLHFGMVTTMLFFVPDVGFDRIGHFLGPLLNLDSKAVQVFGVES